MLHKASYTYKLHCNARPRHWRDSIGQWLREWAELIDGRRTLAIDMDSAPPVPVSVQTDVIRKGVEHMTRCLKYAAGDECMEQLLKKAQPHVFDA